MKHRTLTHTARTRLAMPGEGHPVGAEHRVIVDRMRGDRRKLRACAGVRHSHQGTRAERTIRAAPTRESENADRLFAP